MAKAKSKRQTSSQRHKVERKIRQSKRDVRRAAKAMKASGHKVRSKKVREQAKLALRVSNVNPDKEQILTSFIEAKEAAKQEKLARREEVRETSKAKKLREDPEVDGASDDDSDAHHEEGEHSDSDEDGFEDKATSLFKRSRIELEEAEERLTSKQVQEREKQRKRDELARAATEKQKAAISQHLLIPAGEHVGNPHLQFAKVVDRLALEVNAFFVILDVRCAVESIPWEHIDAVVEHATALQDAAAEQEAAAAKAARPSPGKRGRQSQQAAAAPSDDSVPTHIASSTPQRLVMFVLNKVDLVPADTIAVAYSLVAEEVKARYGSQLSVASPKVIPGATTPVTFTCLPHSAGLGLTAKTIIRAAAEYQKAFLAPYNGLIAAKSNMKGKLAACVIGFPSTGKSAFCRSVQQVGTDSVVSTVPTRTIRTATAKGEDASATKIIVPGAKQLTLVTIADDEELKRTPIVGGDAIYHSVSRLEKMKEPEAAAILLAESFKDQTALCQALSLPAMPTAPAFLKALGRCIIRERGFQPSGIFAGSAGSLSSSSLSASSTMGAAQYMAQLRKVHVKRKYEDGRNPLRIGARVFLKEFHSGQHIVWAVARPAEEAANADVAAVDLFVPLHVPKQVLALLSKDAAAAQAAIAKSPGAVQLMVSQFAIREGIAALPRRCLGVASSAVVPPSTEEDDASVPSDDEEDEEEESVDDEDGDGMGPFADEMDDEEVEEGWEEASDDEDEEGDFEEEDEEGDFEDEEDEEEEEDE